MPERSSISQVVQIGVEATPGTAVAATKRLRSLGIEPSPNIETSQFRPAGSKYKTLAPIGKEWAEASLSGRATYDEILYPLSSVLTTPTGPVVTGTTGQKWTFKPANDTEDTPKTFTVEHGSAVRAAKFAYGLVTEFGMSINRDAVELSGSMMGRRITDGIVLTAGPTFLPLVPVLPTQVDVFMNDTDATIGTTKLGRLLSLEWTIGDRYGSLWVIDSAQQSWVAHVETEPSAVLNMTMEADTAGMALLDTVRAGSTKFVQIKATGPVIGAGPATYELKMNMPVKIVDSGGFSDEDGVFAIEWNTIHVFDSTFDGGLGGSMKIEVTNSLTAL